jgi:hypothetical protein
VREAELLGLEAVSSAEYLDRLLSKAGVRSNPLPTRYAVTCSFFFLFFVSSTACRMPHVTVSLARLRKPATPQSALRMHSLHASYFSFLTVIKLLPIPRDWFAV